MKSVPGVLSLAAALALGVPAFAQNVITAKAGLIHYIEGQVLLDGKAVESKFGSFPQMKEGGVLRTEAGRVEVLLSPGVILRMGENGGLRLISDRLSDTRLELLSGSVLIECAEILKGNAVTIAYKDAAVSLREDGLYRVDSTPGELRVYDGQAVVESGGQIATVKRGKVLALDGTLLARKFDPKAGDALFRWSKRRADYIAMANISAAKSLRDAGRSWGYSDWFWNPYFGMFTYIPRRGIWTSPYGCRYYSPREVYVIYAPPPARSAMASAWDPTPRYNSSLGYSTISPTSSGSSGTVASSSAPTTSSGASSAPIARGGGSEGGRSR